jgi:hypothetical protein
VFSKELPPPKRSGTYSKIGILCLERTQPLNEASLDDGSKAD